MVSVRHEFAKMTFAASADIETTLRLSAKTLLTAFFARQEQNAVRWVIAAKCGRSTLS